jgi:hypothetical protein
VNDLTIVQISPEFKQRVQSFKDELYDRYKRISQENTPEVDGKGKKIVDRRPDGYLYITEAYMREALDKHFPGWSWEMAAPLQFLGGEWVVAQGHLIIIDEYLLGFGINPPYRKFYGCEAAQIMYKKGQIHNVENIVDVGNNVKAANSSALKVAIQRLTHIGDDIYGKRIDAEGAGTLESIFANNPDKESFMKVANGLPGTWGEKFKKLGINSLDEITDFSAALEKLKGE